jgi:hypothetical protein
MCEIINKVCDVDDIVDAFENAIERIYIQNENSTEYKYYRIVITEISEEEYLREDV